MIDLDIEELKQEATELGLTFSGNIGAAKLQARIDEYYKSQETSGNEIAKAVEANEKAETNEKSEEKSVKTGNKSFKEKMVDRKKAANKTRVITIIDNDQRVNNQTTTVVVNATSMYFDLGTKILPLNTPVEVRQGHIDVLKEIKIPQHVKNSKTNLSTVRLVPRYTISYEDLQ
jgi:membrane-associated HD superfamily phosphohydrolase